MEQDRPREIIERRIEQILKEIEIEQLFKEKREGIKNDLKRLHAIFKRSDELLEPIKKAYFDLLGGLESWEPFADEIKAWSVALAQTGASGKVFDIFLRGVIAATIYERTKKKGGERWNG